jgi:Type IX secretion system protein PorV
LFFDNKIALKKIILLTALLFLKISLAQSVRKYSNEFLNIGVDAAALGMGNAVTAHVSDVTAGYWNPAGLMQLKTKQVGLMHANYFANIAQYDYVAFAMPIDDKSAWGASIIRFGVDDILNTTQLIDANGNIDYNRISLFSTADYALNFSYARSTKISGLHYGVNAKVVRRIIGNFASSLGFGLDAGLQYTSAKNWKFGAMFRDITTTYNVWTINKEAFEKIKNAIPGQNQDLPETTEITAPRANLGVAKTFTFKNDYTLTSATNLNMSFSQTNDIINSEVVSINPAVGFEFGYKKIAFLRTGVGNFQEITQIDNSTKIGFQPNIGVGFQYKGIQVDYALTDLGDQSAALYSNIFSLKVDLGIFAKKQ